MSLPQKCLCSLCCSGGTASPKTICCILGCNAPHSSPSFTEEKMSGLGAWAKLICIGNSWPPVSGSGPSVHLSKGLMILALQLPLLSHPYLTGQRHLLGSCWLFKMLMGFLGCRASCQPLNLSIPWEVLYVHPFGNLKLCRFKLLFVLWWPYVFPQRCLYIIGRVNLLLPFHSPLLLRLSIFCLTTTVTGNVTQGEKLRLKNLREVQDSIRDLTRSKRWSPGQCNFNGKAHRAQWKGGRLGLERTAPWAKQHFWEFPCLNWVTSASQESLHPWGLLVLRVVSSLPLFLAH